MQTKVVLKRVQKRGDGLRRGKVEEVADGGEEEV